MTMNLTLVILGMLMAYVLIDVGYKFGEKSVNSKIEEKIEEVEKAIDDFPKTLDGNFFSREAAIRQINMEVGDD